MTPLNRVELPVGAHVGRYRLVERIGGGVNTHVFAAYDQGFDRTVALKCMTAEMQDEREARARFYREARITANLRHPNIVSVLDVGEDVGRPFIVMELLKGLALGDYLRANAPTDVKTVLYLITQLYQGLQAAHAQGAVHRDVKPSNCFVQNDGVLKILDFGLARLHTSTLTAGGVIMGTPAFMSPEQAEGRQVDERSDIFSAAAVSYFMLAGRAPFAAADLPRTLHALLNNDPEPITETTVPAALWRVLSKALAKSPDNRYQHCAEVLADLTDVRRSLEEPPRSGSGVPGGLRGPAPELRRRIAAFAGMVGL
ncbi:MAG: serine/threonine-protein kinase [Vicinamibacterales bacterium]